MNKVALISLYFGKFPANFGLWLKSAARNADIDFLLYGDCDVSAYLPLPPNVKCFSYTFEQMKAKIQSKFDFTIELSRPYKLCDYARSGATAIGSAGRCGFSRAALPRATSCPRCLCWR